MLAAIYGFAGLATRTLVHSCARRYSLSVRLSCREEFSSVNGDTCARHTYSKPRRMFPSERELCLCTGFHECGPATSDTSLPENNAHSCSFDYFGCLVTGSYPKTRSSTCLSPVMRRTVICTFKLSRVKRQALFFRRCFFAMWLIDAQKLTTARIVFVSSG